MVEEISGYRQRILSATVQVPWIPILQKDARVRTTHSSTAIEGNPLTLEEVREVEEDRPVLESTERARREIVNQLAGLRFVERNQSKKIVTRSDLFRLHKIIASEVMDQGEPGRYRTFNVRVGYYIPPPAHQVPRLMSEYLQWWNEKTVEWSPVISSAILHYRFEEIHPFGDGNGRVGRAVALWELYRRGFDTHHIFSVDEIYWEDRPRYYAQLDAVRKAKGDLSGWLEFSAEAIHLTLERVLGRIERLASVGSGAPIILTPKQERLLQLLRDKGGLTPREVWRELEVTKQGAVKILKPMLSSGLIRRIGTRKSGKYVVA
ncbi:MAG TPA: Fic family protein [Bdellovibrionota bacterium]|nr:Fic family protein [Bdellovibrionota bacterium]